MKGENKSPPETLKSHRGQERDENQALFPSATRCLFYPSKGRKDTHIRASNRKSTVHTTVNASPQKHPAAPLLFILPPSCLRAIAEISKREKKDP